MNRIKRIMLIALLSVLCICCCSVCNANGIPADRIIKNAKIFTADKEKPLASALVVKDGKFLYVGDEDGLSEYEGEVTDLEGKFIMPGIIDSHAHVTWPIGFEYATIDGFIVCSGKQEALDIMAKVIREKPGLERYRFAMEQKSLNGEELMKEDLDAICPDSELQIQEVEGHSIWVNSRLLASHGITDDTPDPVPGLSYYERKDGHLTGKIIEGSASVPVILDRAMDLSDEEIDAALTRWIDFSLDAGVNAVFDAGVPECAAFHERVYTRLREMDKQGKLPIYINGSYVIAAPWQAKEGLEELKRFRREFNTEHLKVHTMKIFMDGTIRIHTAALLEPFADTGTTGAPTAFTKEELAALLKEMNEADLDVHLHTVGDAASRTVLDAVELVRNELGERFHIKVTCAHLEVQADEDLERFAKLGVYANFTPSWHSGNGSGDALEPLISLLGERRATNMYRCKTLWDSGALVAWSSDNTIFMDFSAWNPYLGMEVGMTRWTTEKTNAPEMSRTIRAFPPESEKMSIDEMLLGYTINGAIQLGIEDSKGSITVGKDADFLVFDNDLLTAEHEGFSYTKPTEVVFGGKKVK